MSEMNQEQLLANIRKTLDLGIEGLAPDLQTRLDEIRSQSLQRPHYSNVAEDNLEPLVMAAQVSLDDSAEAIPAKTVRRLNQIRSAAINRAQETTAPISMSLSEKLRRLFERHRFAVPASAFATACVLVTVATLAFQLPAPSGIPSSDEDIMLFASTDEIELYENLAFYQWLASSGLTD
ncbi:MAG: hypothetical protein JKY98_08360 [Gammaproteobacteria bacterium]|nr:hypothetical protein [Gammaproteobacteria bacterium]